MERHTCYSNIKLYYTDTKPENIGENLSDSDLIWDLGDFTVSGGTEITGGKAGSEGLSGLTLGETPQRNQIQWKGTGALEGIELRVKTTPASLEIDSEGDLKHTHSGFQVTAKGLETEKYLAAVYDVTVDWEAVYGEAQKILGNCRGSGQFVNEVINDKGEKEIVRLDLNDARIISSPYYYLQQNDVIYVKANDTKARQSYVPGNEGRTLNFWVSLATMLTALGVLLFK